MKKKLRLHKESLRRLSANQLRSAAGGLPLIDTNTCVGCKVTDGCRSFLHTWCGNDSCWCPMDPF